MLNYLIVSVTKGLRVQMKSELYLLPSAVCILLFCCCFRLQPTASIIPRVVDQELEICGYQIPAKVDICITALYTAD